MKDILFNPLKIKKISLEIKSVYPAFKELKFEEEVCHIFPELELKARIYHIRDMLKKYLPEEYESAVNILLNSLPKELDATKSDDDFGDFIYAPYSEFVRMYGCSEEHLMFSLESLRELTKRFSVEFAIRDFINNYPKQTLAMLSSCALSENYHERRLASEGLRPKLPWAKKLTLDHRETLTHLDQLFDDNTRYVTRSVANHLNDIAKIDAPLVIETLKRWKVSGKQNTKEMGYITNHALRTLVKQGYEDAFLLLGYVKDPDIRVSSFMLHTEDVRIGDALIFDLILEAKEDTKLIIDYIVHFRTKAGTFSPKVHKLKKIELKKDTSITLQKKHYFKANMSTRRLYEGKHKVELQINGVSYKENTFILRRSEMNFKQLDRYLLSKEGVTFDYPFDEKVRVYRIAEKMFALTSEEIPITVNLKCDPIYALELRSIYEGIKAGYHMNKKHWNTVSVEDSDVDAETVKELIDHSYALVYKSLTKKKREALG